MSLAKKVFAFMTLLSASFAASACQQGAGASKLAYEHFTLKNGMEVYVLPDHRSPVVVNFVWYKIGAADEVSGTTGIAHMLEHLMFKGTDKIPPQEFSKIVARNGGQDNAFTFYDYTAYYQKVAKDRLPKMMEMEADRMANLTFTDKEFLPERDVVMEERRWRTDSNPSSRFYEALQHTHLPHHPYGRPVIGWKEDISHFTRAKALDWYKTYYNPSNAILILAGDVTAADVKELAEKTYGSIEAKPAPRPVWAQEPVSTEPKRLEQVDKDVKVPMLYRLYRVPSRFAAVGGGAPNPRDALALAVLAEIVGGSQTGRLYEDLVKTKQIADSASADYSATLRGESSFDVAAQPKPGVPLSVLETAVNETIAEVQKNGVTQEELDRARTGMLSSDIYARDDVFVSAYRLGIWLMGGGSADDFEAWRSDIKTLTPAEVQKAAQTYLVPAGSTTGLLAASKKSF